MRWFVAGLVLLVLIAGATADAAKPDSVINAEEFLRLSSDEKLVYAKGTLDTLFALVAERALPREKALCARRSPVTLGEVIGTAEAYLYKTLASDMRDQAKMVPAALWLVRAYWAKCGEPQ